MRLILSFFVFTIISINSSAQSVHIGVFGGASAYNGDLTQKIFQKKLLNAVVGITGNYELGDQFMLRAGVTLSKLGAADRYNVDSTTIKRNLSFETSLVEFSVVGEYYLLNMYNRRYSPYAFAGLAVYHYNPYTYTAAGEKVFLRPLSTEGQGISGYPNRKVYPLTQIALPFGGGIKFAVNDNLRIGAEIGFRKLFTDYLDDVSSEYANPGDLLAAKGQQAVDLSYRGDELPGGDPVYPAKGAQRGGADKKDYYYFGGLHLTYRLGGEKGMGKRSKTGCPTNIY
jgi:hypothetical protein